VPLRLYYPRSVTPLILITVSVKAQTHYYRSQLLQARNFNLDKNYIAKYTPRVDGILSSGDVYTVSSDKTREVSSVEYFDGLGRPLQTVQVISTGTLHNLRANGTLPFTKIGGVAFYDMIAVEQILEKHTTYQKSSK
jgi:hypothetical protein